MLNDLLDEFSPETASARNLVEDAAMARWFLWRKVRAYNAIETDLYSAEPDESKWSDEAHHKLALADRYKTAGERAFKRALNNVQSLRKTGLEERRLHLQEQKFRLLERRDNRHARKEELEAELAATQAAESLNEFDAKQWNAACAGFDQPTLVQKIDVTRYDGETTTVKSPSNSGLLRQLERHPHSPRRVCRKFTFPDGIPPEYYSFTDNEAYRREKGHTIEQLVSIEIWRDIVRQEAELGTGHAVPGPML